MKFSFTPVGKKANGKKYEWGVRATSDSPNGATGFAGKDIEVRKRDGSMRDVTLGALIDAKDGGKVGIYSLGGDSSNGAGPSAVESIVNIAMVLQAKTWSRTTLDKVADLVEAYGLPVTKPPVKKAAAAKKAS